VTLPQVNSLAPNNGDVTGGEEVTITGHFLTGATVVNFGSVAAVSFTVVDDQHITAVAPAASGFVTGQVDVTVTTSAGTSALAGGDHFNYTAPTLSDLLEAIVAVGVQVGVVGVQVASDTAQLTSLQTNVSQIYTASVGLASQMMALQASVNGLQASVNELFTGIPGATVESVVPSSGLSTGGTEVTITGLGFTGATAVYFGSVAAESFTVVDDDSITAVSPVITSGVVNITVVNYLGKTSFTPTGDSNQFTVHQVPVVTGITPNTAHAASPGRVTITGVGFTGVLGVAFIAPGVSEGGEASGFIISNTDTEIICNPPADSNWAPFPVPTGPLDVVVGTAFGGSAISPADQFTYD
jgi:hypothetical protein